MTPVERSQAITEGKAYDRLPTSLFVGEIKARLIDESFDQIVHSVDAIVASEIETFNRFGADGLSCGPNSYGIGTALGADVVYPKDSLPHPVTDYLSDYAMLDNMEPVDPYKDQPVKNKLEALNILAEEAEGIVGISSSVGGAMTIASYLRGAENLLKDLRKNPDEVKKLLNFIVQSQKNCIDAFAPYGVRISLGDPVSSGSLLSPKLFKEFSYPALKEISDYAYEKTGKKATLHICGKTERNWEAIRQLNLASYSLDNQSDLAEALDFFGDKMAVVGNIPPVDIMHQGTEEEIHKAVKESIQVGQASGHSHIVAFGCDIPAQAPVENLDYYMDAVRTYGSFEAVKSLG
jgi:uroporphyrinogen decarboxylase